MSSLQTLCWNARGSSWFVWSLVSDARDRLTTRELTFVREFAYRVACFRDRRPTSLKDTLLRHIYFYYSFIRPPVCSNGRTYKMLVMFFFLSPGSLRRPSTNRRETLPHDRKLVRLDKFSPKIRGALPPPKMGGQKHAKFRAILYHF